MQQLKISKNPTHLLGDQLGVMPEQPPPLPYWILGGLPGPFCMKSAGVPGAGVKGLNRPPGFGRPCRFHAKRGRLKPKAHMAPYCSYSRWWVAVQALGPHGPPTERDRNPIWQGAVQALGLHGPLFACNLHLL